MQLRPSKRSGSAWTRLCPSRCPRPTLPRTRRPRTVSGSVCRSRPAPNHLQTQTVMAGSLASALPFRRLRASALWAILAICIAILARPSARRPTLLPRLQVRPTSCTRTRLRLSLHRLPRWARRRFRLRRPSLRVRTAMERRGCRCVPSRRILPSPTAFQHQHRCQHLRPKQQSPTSPPPESTVVALEQRAPLSCRSNNPRRRAAANLRHRRASAWPRPFSRRRPCRVSRRRPRRTRSRPKSRATGHRTQLRWYRLHLRNRRIRSCTTTSL